MRLTELLERSAARAPEHVAIESGAGEGLSYGALDRQAEELAHALRSHGVGPGDRVGLQLPKSIASVVSIFASMKAGGAYVPVDSQAPLDRNTTIFGDCGVRAIVVGRAQCDALCAALTAAAAADEHAAVFSVAAELPRDLVLLTTDAERQPGPPDLAYILSTSGSTGRPKGVQLTHGNALSFVHWCADTFDVGPDDRFSSHAPFHFDLSILDIYLSLGTGGTLVLIDEDTGRQPRALAPLIAERRLTVWYSTPSILALLVQHGRLERHDASALRYVLFAGEVFPVRHLRTLTELWPTARYFNLYGPTETNVCTFHEVTLPVPAQRHEPYPIGHACAHVETRVLDERGAPVPGGTAGELCVRGAPVTAGYWNLPERTASAFHATDEGAPWYRTGDIVHGSADGYVFAGRQDRMVKRRGYRIELGEVEARLHRHPDVTEVAVIALPHEDDGVQIKAFMCWGNGSRPSLIKLKAFCANELPGSMVPDVFSHHESLPKTSTDKVDYQRLRSLGDDPA